MLMAVVPCTVTVVHGILDNAARTAGLPRELTAQVVMGLRDDVCGPPGDDRTERAVRAEIECARTGHARSNGALPVPVRPACTIPRSGRSWRTAFTLSAP